MEPALRLFVPAILREADGDLERRVKEQLPVVAAVRVVGLERDIEVRQLGGVDERPRAVVTLEPGLRRALPFAQRRERVILALRRARRG